MAAAWTLAASLAAFAASAAEDCRGALMTSDDI